jgi:predicted RNA methylase
MRNAGKLRLGYFPLPTSVGPLLRERLDYLGPASVLDPCAGTGAALLAISTGVPVNRYAIELDADRAEAAQAAGIETIRADANEVTGEGKQVSLLYLNPPYDFECGSYDNDRLENVFLRFSSRWLVPGGVLVFVIPQKALYYCCDSLAARFSNHRVFRLTDPESEKYNQIVVFAYRKDQSDRAVYQDARELKHLSYVNYDKLPELESYAQDPWRLTVPVTGPAKFAHQGVDLDSLEDLQIQSAAWFQSRLTLLPAGTLQVGNPLTPLHGGHVGLLCTAGLMNGVFGEGEERHIARWRTTKVTTVIEEGEQDDDSKVVRSVERFAHDLAIVYETGQVQSLGSEASTPDSDSCIVQTSLPGTEDEEVVEDENDSFPHIRRQFSEEPAQDDNYFVNNYK